MRKINAQISIDPVATRKALRNIKPGEVITYHYGELWIDRQSLVWGAYNPNAEAVATLADYAYNLFRQRKVLLVQQKIEETQTSTLTRYMAIGTKSINNSHVFEFGIDEILTG